MIDRVLKVFILEDRPAEAELTKRAVLKHAPNALFVLAVSESEFLEKISWNEYDLILGDYHLPGYNGLEALFHVKEHYPGIPFIFVTGTLNSEVKVADAVLKGANGFVLKDDLSRLPAAMDAALAVAAERKAERMERNRRQKQRELRLMKVHAILQQSEDFPQKQELVGLMEEVLEA